MIEHDIEAIIDALVEDVTYEKTWPSHTAYYQVNLNMFQEVLRHHLKQRRLNAFREIYDWAKKEHRESYGERAETLEDLKKHITSVTGVE